MCCTATAQRGVGSAGFHTTVSPQTAASAAFHDHTATGKLNAVMMPIGPERVPLFHHPVARALGGDGQAVELPRQADGEVADVDHLLHFAVALRADLAHLEADEIAQRLLGGAQRLAEVAHELAALGRRRLAPRAEAGAGGRGHAVVGLGRGQLHAGNRRAGRRIVGGQHLGAGGEGPVGGAGRDAGVEVGEAETLEDGARRGQ